MSTTSTQQCENCGSLVPTGASFCTQCGTPSTSQSSTTPPIAGVTTKFCVSCGHGLVATAVICPACGSQTPGRSGGSGRGKDKTTALLLAIFVSGWTWLYLYERRSRYFWGYLIAQAATIALILIAVFGTFATTVSQCNGHPDCQPNPGGILSIFLFFFLAVIVQLGLHIWAIADVATKDKYWYDTFGSSTY